MTLVEHTISHCLRLTAILILNISDIDYLVNKIIKITNEDSDHHDMIRAAIGNLIVESFQRAVPPTAYAGLLNNMLIDDYRIALSLTNESRQVMNTYICELIAAVHTKIDLVAKLKKHTPITIDTALNDAKAVFMISNIDLNILRNIEFRFYERA